MAAGMRQRCERLYVRLDEAHRSTRQDSLHLRATRLLLTLHRALDSLNVEGFDISLPQDDPKLMLDVSCFALCIEDILQNAMDACEGLPSSRCRIEIAVRREPGYVVLLIRDHGVGLPKGKESQLFTPFYSTKPTKHNWGVGLSLVYRVVHAHGGDVSIANAAGGGAIVQITLPALDEAYRRGENSHGTDDSGNDC